MSQCQCKEIESVFDRALAEDELARERTRGPRRTTRLLLEALQARGVEGKTLLDVGGGVGTIPHKLLASGLKHATDVDASTAYLKTARKESRRLGFEDRVAYHHGDFVDVAREVSAADIVTLDRVICCYDDVEGLVEASARKARWLYAAVYPRDAWWTRIWVQLINLTRRLKKDDFRVFAHPSSVVESILGSHGLKRSVRRCWGMWQVAVFEKGRPPAARRPVRQSARRPARQPMKRPTRGRA